MPRLIENLRFSKIFSTWVTPENKFVISQISGQNNQKIVTESYFSLSKGGFIMGLFPIDPELVRAIEINEEARDKDLRSRR